MDAVQLFSAPYGTITRSACRQFLEVTYLGDFSHEDYRTLYVRCRKAVLRYQTPRVLIDTRQGGSIELRSRAWLLLEAVPTYREMSDQTVRLAIVIPPALPLQSGFSYTLGGIKRLAFLDHAVFREVDEARQWLTATDSASPR